MFGRSMYTPKKSMMMMTFYAILALVALYMIVKYVTAESAIGNPYAGTFDGRIPIPIFGTTTIPASSY